MEDMIYETQKRIEWYIQGIGIHGLTPQLMKGLSTERICEIYNIELEYFRPKND
jgi:hypothetical protein